MTLSTEIKSRHQSPESWTGLIHTMIGQSVKPNQHQPCPACGGKDRFRFTNRFGNGDYICSQCGAGDGINLIAKCLGISDGQAIRQIAEHLGIQSEKPIQSHVQYWHKPLIQHIQGHGVPVKGTLAEKYLIETRGLAGIPIDRLQLSFISKVPYYHDRQLIGYFPAMAGVLINGDKAVGCHCTYLDSQGRKADVESPKKYSKINKNEDIKGAFIPVISIGKQITGKSECNIAEGIENALTAYLMNGASSYAAGNAWLLEHAELPNRHSIVNIFADNDANNRGRLAANRLKQRLKKKGHSCRVYMPPPGMNDFLDYYKKTDEEIVS